MNRRKLLNKVRGRRKKRTRATLSGSATVPRIAIFRSNRYITAQLIDDDRGVTLCMVTSRGMQTGKKTKTQEAALVGESLAKKALEMGLKKAILDRRTYRYHGRVQAFVEGARKAGIRI